MSFLQVCSMTWRFVRVTPYKGSTIQYLRGVNNFFGAKSTGLFARKRYLSTDAKVGSDHSHSGPLSGVRILDLSRILAGPYATMVLGDLGAEVIKVERPGSGDLTRGWGPPFCGNESAYFLSINRNKKSVCVDFQHPEGKDIVRELAKKSDVLVENFLPGKLSSLGLGYHDLQKISPGLIYCSISGYGQNGPYKKRGGYDVVAAAVGGLIHITGPEDGEPCRVGVAVTDIATGLYAHGAIIAALLEKQKTGQGKYIDCSLLSTQIAVLSHIAVNYLNEGVDLGRTGTGHHSIVPYQAFKTKDGYVVVGAGSDTQFVKFCKIIGMPSLAKEEQFSTNALRVTNRRKLIPILLDRFSEHSNQHWLKEFDGSGLPYGPINNMAQVFEDPQVKYRQMVLDVDHPTAGNIKMPGPAVEYDGKRTLNKTKPPPLLGQHTDHVLRNVLHLDDTEIERLIRLDVVGMP